MNHAVANRTVARICLSLAVIVANLTAASLAVAGSIRATIAGDQKIVSVSAIERDTHGTDGVVSVLRNFSFSTCARYRPGSAQPIRYDAVRLFENDAQCSTKPFLSKFLSADGRASP